MVRYDEGMRGWRRVLRSWPIDTLRTADPASLPKWANDPERVRTAQREEIFSSLLVLGLFSLLPAGLAFTFAAWLAGSGHDLAAILAVFAGFGLAMSGVLPACKFGDERRDRLRRSRTLNLLEGREESTLGGESVGVAYSEFAWHYPEGGHDLDDGVFATGLDALTFVGRQTRFELPAAAILSTEIHYFDAALHGPDPRLYICWAHEGRAGTLSLSLPKNRFVRRRVSGMEELRERIERWRGEPFPRRSSPYALPPSVEPTAVVVSPKNGWRAKLLAAVATLVFFVMVETLGTMLAIRMGWSRSGHLLMALVYLSPAVWVALTTIFERKLPARWRHPEAEASPEILPGTVQRDEEETIRVRA